jgi:hypothetical protein
MQIVLTYPYDIFQSNFFNGLLEAIFGPDHRIGHFRPLRTIAGCLEYRRALVLKHFYPRAYATRVADDMIEAQFFMSKGAPFDTLVLFYSFVSRASRFASTVCVYAWSWPNRKWKI